MRTKYCWKLSCLNNIKNLFTVRVIQWRTVTCPIAARLSKCQQFFGMVILLVSLWFQYNTRTYQPTSQTDTQTPHGHITLRLCIALRGKNEQHYKIVSCCSCRPNDIYHSKTIRQDKCDSFSTIVLANLSSFNVAIEKKPQERQLL